MEINTRICFVSKNTPDLVKYLVSNGIPYEENCILSVIEMSESDPHWPVVRDIAKAYGLIFQSEIMYSKQELRDAEWLHMRSKWKFGYPQPENTFVTASTTYSGECSECGSCKTQVEPFRIKKAPKWGKRGFAELYWVNDEIFVSELAKEMLLKERITGITFLNVLDKKGNAVLEDIYQLVVQNVLENGFFASPLSVSEYQECSLCGTTKYVISGRSMLEYKKSIFENQPDIVKTGDVFGSGYSSNKMIMVRQSVYQAIVKNKMDRALSFEPILLR
ncbi:MAG: hypothetical protein E7597_05020 [Ruminococcaceae bacterium]|nr:hypothetical protein [Oscillospiraceae bacterium]